MDRMREVPATKDDLRVFRAELGAELQSAISVQRRMLVWLMIATQLASAVVIVGLPGGN